MPDKMAARWLVPVFCILAAAHTVRAIGSIDYAEARSVNEWLHHPVYGDPSLDTFVHSPGNPIVRGTQPYEWPVNGFLFWDPPTGSRYLYAGEYGRGYGGVQPRCHLYHSVDAGKSWKDLGVVLQGETNSFDHGGGTPDVSVVYDQGRYHMIYDWVEPGVKGGGGLGYAWADKPEGPFHRATEPITRNQSLPVMLGRYQRTYAATLIHRKNDWLILGMMDHPPNSWCYFGMTAAKPEGPYGERVILHSVESDSFHPPLLEFYPAFVERDWIYAPATSVALNRDYNAMYRVPMEKALKPDAWQLWQNGSVWHSENVENEASGLWGQTFSGSISPVGDLQVVFPSRDKNGMGTLNFATRAWHLPVRVAGFVLSGHAGPSLTLLGQAYKEGHLQTKLQVQGTARLILDYHGALGPNKPESDATISPTSFARCEVLELNATEWRLLAMDDKTNRVIDSGQGRESWNLDVMFETNGKVKILNNNRLLHLGNAGELGAKTNGWTFGWMAEPDTHLAVETFRITGVSRGAHFNFLAGEALLGAGAAKEDWIDCHGPEFRFGEGAIANGDKARVKWNVPGQRFTLWSPKGPHLGRVEIHLDGQMVAGIDLHSAQSEPSQPVWTSRLLHDTGHAITLTATSGKLVVDSLEAEQ